MKETVGLVEEIPEPGDAPGGAAIPAVSATPVHIDAEETFEGSGSTFTSTIEGCSSGTVSNGPFRIGGGPGTDFGKFNGFKAFERRLRRSPPGEVRRGGVHRNLGDCRRLGTLVGTPTSTGINDVYDGTLRP